MFLSNKTFKTKTLSLSLILVLTFSIIPLFDLPPASAQPYELTRKWTGYVSGGGEALLTADVIPSIPGEEVFHAGGGPQPGGAQGSVTCLNGMTGAVIWKTGRNGVPALSGVGDTCQIHMVDMDSNGDLEIVVPAQAPAGVYILHAENGQLMFTAASLGGGRIDSSPVSADVDDNGYPDLFIGVMAYEQLPSTGKVIRYEWNPATNSVVERDRVTVWHPCAGGLSIGDTDNDNVWELYMNERDVYFGDGSWGRGIVSFWAENLTVRWQVYDWGASSNIPMLADVNKDGVIDVVSTDLSSGICVLNSTTGRPLSNGVRELIQTRITGRANHYQSSIYDIDDDGNLEILSGDGFEGRSNYVTIFDLWEWKLDKSIDTTAVGPVPTRSWKGPTVGEVTGDGIMDIIVTTFDPETTNNGQVQVYNRNYELVYLNTGLRHRAIESVVQDVDKDDGGLNELLVLTQGGVIYCFETPGIASNPRARSEVQFYSESRCGASEYVHAHQPYPDVSVPQPTDGAINISTGLSSLSFRLSHPLGETMTYTVTTSPNVGGGSGSVPSRGGTRSVSISGLEPGTMYHWYVTVTDQSGRTTNKHYTFTTGPYTPNSAPTQSTPTITGSLETDDLVAAASNVNDPDGDAVINIYNWERNGVSIANLYLPFETQTDPQDEYSGLATTRDYALGATAQVFGASWTSNGKVGGAYSFNGNDFIRILEPTSASGRTRYDGDGSWSEMSIELWVKANTMSSTERLITKTNLYDSATSYRIDCACSGGSLSFNWRVGTGTTENPTTYTLGTYTTTSGAADWHHVVCTYKSGVGLKLYVDGVLVKSLLGPEYSGNILNTDGPFHIAFGSGSDFQGLIDEVKLYPYELSAFAVMQRYLDTSGGLSSNSTISKYETKLGEMWRCRVTPNDHKVDGDSMYTATRTIVDDSSNRAPVASNLTITPSSPVSTDDLVATYTYYDADGHPEGDSIIRWYKNGVNVFNSSSSIPILPEYLTSKGENWSFSIIPSDGFSFGPEVSSGTVTIGNVNATTSVYIIPDPAFATSTLTAVPKEWIDPDNEPPGYIYQWQKMVAGTYTNISGATGPTLSNVYFAAGDWIRVLVTPFDGESFGAPAYFETQIVSSAAPTTGTVMLFSTSGNNRDDDELTCQAVGTQDPDGPLLTNIYNWQRGGTSITNIYLPFAINSSINAKDYSGYGNNAFIDGSVWTDQGVIGGCYRFNGSSYMIVNDSPSLGSSGGWTELTVEYWVNPAVDQRGARILNKNGGSPSESGKFMTGFNTNNPPNTVFFGLIVGGTYEESSYRETYDTTTTRIPSGSWSHIVGTYKSGEGIKLYINGTLRSFTRGISGTIEASEGEPLIIGYASTILGTANRYFNGMLDEVRIYPTALSAAQVFQNFLDQKDGLAAGITIVPQETAIGQTWRCQVTSNDGWQDGATITSNQFTISSSSINSRPRIDWYQPADSTIYVPVGQTIDFMQASSDPDNSPLSYNWTLNSVQQATTQNWSFTPQSTGSYTVRVTVSDGTASDYQEWAVNVGEGTPPVQYNLHVEVYGGGITNASGNTLYDAGSVVKVLATANPDCSFVGWLLNGTSVGSVNPYSLTMDANYNLTAVFTQLPTPQYRLTVQTSGQGITNVTGTGVYDSGTQISVLATAAEGWEFSHWLLNGTNVGSSNPSTLTMNANYALTAVFSEETNIYDDFETGNLSKWDGFDGTTVVITTSPYAGTYHMRNTLSSAANNGWAGVYKNISGNSTVTLGAQVRFNQPPNTDDEDQWVLAFTQSTGGNALAYAGVRQVNGVDYWAIWYISSGTILTYQVSTVPYTEGYHYLQLTLKRGTANDGLVEFRVDGQLVCQATNLDNDGRVLNYGRVGFSYSDAASSASSTVDIDNVELSFESPTPEIVYYLTANVNGNGMIIKNPDRAAYVSGSTVQLTAVPQPGWTFAGWSGDLSGTTNPQTITMNANKSVTAHFEPEIYFLTVNVIGQGSVTKNPNQASYTYGTTVQLIANATEGWVFSGWSGDLTGTTSPASITMNANKTVTATFTEISGPEVTEDFESGGLSYWTGQDGTAAISTVSPYRGTYHLSCSLSSGANNGWSGVYKSISGTNPVYLSAYVRFNAPPNTNDEDQWVLAFTQSTAGNALAYGGIRNVGGTLYWAIWYLSAGSSTLTLQVSTIEYTPGWHNLELALYRGTSNDGWVQLTVDGTVVCYAGNLDNDGRTLNYARVGFSYSDAPSSTSTTVSIDDITIGSSPPTQPTIYAVSLQSQQDTQATSNLGTIICQGTNYALPGASYEEAGVCSVAYNAADGYMFSHWECTGGITVSNVNQASTTITVAGNGTLKAIYTATTPPPQYSLTININGQGSVTKTPNQSTYPSGSVVTLNAVPSTGYVFSGWSGDLTGSATPVNITVTGDMTITATFTSAPPPQAYWFINGFEEPLPGNWSGTDGNADRSTANVYQGTYSLRCTLSTGVNNGWSGAYKSLSGLSTANPITLSAYVYLSAPPNTNNEDQWVLAFAQDPAANALAYAGVHQVNGQLHWAIWYLSAGSSTLTLQVSTIEYTPGWHNLELALYRGTSNDGWVQLTVDGTVVCYAGNLDNDGRTLNYARVGFSYSDAPSSASATLYVDDVTIE